MHAVQIAPPFRATNSRNDISISHIQNDALASTLDPYALCFLIFTPLTILPPKVDFSKNAYPHPTLFWDVYANKGLIAIRGRCVC